MSALAPSATGALADFVWSLCAPERRRDELAVDAPPDGAFVYVRARGRELPSQGWKLHVSANERSACEVLAAAVPILTARGIPFKVVASLSRLHELNHGQGGQTQVGKFLTAYPRDDDEAVAVAAALEAATTGMEGPRVPSDRPIGRGGLVHYRYGSFGGRYLQSPVGETMPALVEPSGGLVPDRRETYYSEPAWRPADPFAALSPLDADRRETIGRYQLVAEIGRSAHNVVWLALDTEHLRTCVVKRPIVGACSDDPARRLLHEAAVLRRLAAVAAVPRLLDTVDDDAGQPCLVLEDVGGRSLDRLVADMARLGTAMPFRQVLDIARRLTGVLVRVHAMGLVHADVKSANIVVEPNGRLRLLDWDNCAVVGDGSAVIGRGSAGYASPQRAAGDLPSVADDVYAVGGVLFAAMTGAEPASRPRGRLVPVPDGLPLRADVPAAFESLVASCLDPVPARRPRDAGALRSRLDAIAAPRATVRRRPRRPARATDARQWSSRAERIGEELIREMAPDPHEPPWLSPAADGSLHALRDVNSGVAGILLALCDLADAFDDGGIAHAVRRGADWLARSRPLQPPGLPGLFVGEAGVALALLRCAEVLQHDGMLAAAAERSRAVARRTHASPDMFNGTAGRLRGHLAFWRATGDRAHLDDAVACGDRLLEASTASEGRREWPIPPGYGGLSGTTQLGYAHGTAGIGDALLELYEATGGEPYADAAIAAADGLRALVHDDASCPGGASWGQTPAAEPHIALWCHGATGIGLFFVRLHRSGRYPPAAALAARAMGSVAAARWVGPVLCHGLAGNVLALLEAREAGVVAAADHPEAPPARSLAAFIDAGGPRHSSLARADYMIGRAGLSAAALVLAGHRVRSYALLMGGGRKLG